jgi:ADP-L-glycero-D-manno-heptose 6-epimerase
MWNFCTKHQIPLVYASSAATYGLGEFGYEDSHEVVSKLKPLNPYGDSKNEFDKWCLRQAQTPPLWAGLKFFNVYGPNEYHKSRMASVVFHSYNQIKDKRTTSNCLNLIPRWIIKMVEQKRDFVYVKDVVNVLFVYDESQT